LEQCVYQFKVIVTFLIRCFLPGYWSWIWGRLWDF